MRRLPALALSATLLALAVISVTTPAAGQPADDPSTGPDAVELVERYAPVIAVRPQDEPCDTSGEQYLPAPAELVLDNPHVVLRQIGVGDPVVKVGPTSRDLFDMGEAFFIDFPGDAFRPGCIYEEDFHRYNDGRNAVVYAHVATQPDRPDRLAVQYWFFYYYNRYNNLHEGDWEGIQLLFEVGTVAEALRTEPVSIGYSQHFGGEIAGWNDAKLERHEGTHAVVYPAVGSHASYFEPALYLGRSGSQGFGCDTTVDATRRIEPDVVLLPHTVDDPDDPLAWLTFEGLWGERRFGPFSGATGPITKPRWTAPIDWHDTLRDSSVVVPQTNASTEPYIDRFCNVVEFGSRQYLTAQQSPLRTSLILAAAGLVVWFVAGRTAWNAVDPLPIVAKRRLGQIVTTAGRFYWNRRRRLVPIALVQLPLAIGVTVLSGLIGLLTSPLGIVGSALTGIASGAGQIFVLLVVNATMLRAIAGIDGTLPDDGGTAAAYRWTWSKLGVLVPAFVRGAGVVVGLAITIVGIPWAIRQYVRYQIATAVIVFEDLGPRAALRRCSELVTGRKRWWHTALVVGTLQLLVAGLGAVAGLLALIVINGLPLGFYSAIASIGGVIVLPYLGTAIALLYGNVRAEAADDGTGADAGSPDPEPQPVA